MSTWQIVSAGGNDFRWQVSQPNPNDDVSDATTSNSPVPNSTTSRLPSMADLLLQGCSNLLMEGVNATTPVKLDVGAGMYVGEEHGVDNIFSFSNSMFKTGSGKRVTISSDGLVRAKTLLGMEDDTVDYNIQSLQHIMKLNATGETNERLHTSHLQLHKSLNSYGMISDVSHPSPSSMYNPSSVSSVDSSHTMKNDFVIDIVQPETDSSAGKQGPIKFHTAGGRSISISNDALQRAKRLLGDPNLGGFLDGGDAGDSLFSFPDDQKTSSTSGERNDFSTPLAGHVKTQHNHMTKNFTSPLQSSGRMEFSTKFPREGIECNLIGKFDTVGNESDCSLKSSMTCEQKPINEKNQVPDTTVYHSSLNGFSSKVDLHGMMSGSPLADISNTMNLVHTNITQPATGKRSLGSRVTVSPFKRPRSLKFSPPLKQEVGISHNGLSKLSSVTSGCKRKVSTRYPIQKPRIYIKEFFAGQFKQKVHIPNHVRKVTSDNAKKYIFHDGSSDNGLGAEAFVHLLAQHGAVVSNAWIMNHYKWIIWKLASYERCCLARSAGKLLTVSNVLEELKYRYEREVNHGHQSTIRKILEGDAFSSSMMILCISGIHVDCGMEGEILSETKTGAERSGAVKVELTDGWYSMNATLDVPLLKQLALGRLFVGQKLRIWGAGLSSWTGPVSPLEVPSTVSLLLHINGTYRVHWAERLGFCKEAGPPLAFRCIKSDGGPIPQTLAGITRIYPILYKERLSSGLSVVISERMENKISQLYNQRHSAVVESIMSEFQKERKDSHIYTHSDSEGAKIYKMLETAAEPEFLMADMSPEQLSSFAAYKAKLDAIRQYNLEKSITKALEDAGLKEREITKFMRVRVVGLTHRSRQDKPKEGIITIWNPTEKQQLELVEGQAYVITGLKPTSDVDILHLKATGCSSRWLPLTSNASELYKSFFSCRKSISLSSLSAIPLSGEFDIAAYVVHVGEVYTSGQQTKQWVFVTDGSISGLQSEKLISSLLAICFCSPSMGCDSFPSVNYNLAGSTVGFCDLIKKAKDNTNHIWVAEATENSTYYLSFDSLRCSHFRNVANSIRKWANVSSLTIEKIKERVLSVVGDCKG